MKCMFCHNDLERVSHPGSARFVIVKCRACHPIHYTLHRELYYAGSSVKLYDQIQIDEFIITRYYQCPQSGNPIQRSKLYKEAYGVIDNMVDATPLGKFPAICEVDHIINLPVHDLAQLKKKLQLWTTFS